MPQASTIQHNSPVVPTLAGPSLPYKGAPVSTVSSSPTQESCSSASSSLACQGLLEVQPLHFVCCSTSDGARVERGDIQQVASSLGPSGVPSAVPLLSSAMPIPPPAALPTVSASLAALEEELQMLKVAVFYKRFISHFELGVTAVVFDTRDHVQSILGFNHYDNNTFACISFRN